MEQYTFKPHPDVIVTILDEDEATLIHLGSKLTYALNGTGLSIWTFMKEGCTLEELIDHIRENFDVGPTDVGRDTQQFLEELLELGLITIA